jgi:DNA-binding HxlR family transcriptional regulator
MPLEDRGGFAESTLDLALPQPMEGLAQALSPLAQIAPIRNGCRTAGRPLGRSNAGPSASGHVELNALEIVSSRNRARIVSSAQSALGLIRGKWTIPILVTMLDGPVRLGQLRRRIPRASKKVLVQQLHELEKDGIIVRTDLSGKIKHVEYAISAPLGSVVINLLGFLSDWGMRYAPPMALHGRSRIGATPVLPMPAKSEILAASSVLFGPKRLHRVKP